MEVKQRTRAPRAAGYSMTGFGIVEVTVEEVAARRRWRCWLNGREGCAAGQRRTTKSGCSASTLCTVGLSTENCIEALA
jgi:hypothetical protein